MDILPPHWSEVDEITDLAKATQIKINTRLIKIAAPKSKDKKPLLTDRGTLTPRLPSPGYPPPTGDYIAPARADDSRRNAMPPTFLTSLTFMIHIKNEKVAGKTQAALKLQYSVPPSDGCWLCRFKVADRNFHKESECKILKSLYAYSSVLSSTYAMPYKQQQAYKTTSSLPALAPLTNQLQMC